LTSTHFLCLSLLPIGDSTELEAIGSGFVVFSIDQHGGDAQLSLSEVWYVPKLGCNLMSVKHLTQAGASVAFSCTDCIIEKAGMLIKVQGQGSLYSLVEKRKPVETGHAHVSLTASQSGELWHRRLGHLSYGGVRKLMGNDMVKGMPPVSRNQPAASAICEPCVLAKHHRDPFPKSSSRQVRNKLDLVHMDICGPLPESSLGGSKYVATFLDEYSHLSAVCPIAYKSEVTDTVQQVLIMLEVQSGCKVKTVRTDRGGEYVNHALNQWFKSEGIVHETTAPYTPQQNGAAERLNRTLFDKVRAMLFDAKLPRKLWAEAVVTANYLRNRSPCSASPLKTPYELFFDDKPDVNHLRVFGCTAYAHVPAERRDKLDARSQKGIFVGYEPHSKAFRILVNSKIIVSRDVVFDEARMGDLTGDDDASDEYLYTFDVLDDTPLTCLEHENLLIPVPEPVTESSTEDGPTVTVDDPSHSSSVPLTVVQEVTGEQPEQAERRYPLRDRRPPAPYWASVAQSSDDPDPPNEKVALSGPDADLWKQAMDEEMVSLLGNNTWSIVPLPAGVKPVPVKWVFKKKRNAAGNVERYKARLVAKGYRQVEGIDYSEVYAPVSKHTSLRALLSVVAARDLELHHLDIKTAFLNGELEEEIYINQPPCYEHGSGMVCKLHKSLYGLKQAPRAWYTRLKHELEEIGFSASGADPGLFIRPTGGIVSYILVYVDDLLLAASDKRVVQDLKDVLSSIFDLRDMGDATYFLGMEIQRSRSDHVLLLSQRRFSNELVHKFGLSDAKPKSVPLSTAARLSRNDGQPATDKPYSELVGALLYLSVCTRPDFAQCVGVLARYMSAPTCAHWEAAKSILRYLCGTVNLGLRFARGSDITVLGYCDADYAGEVDTRKSTTGYVFILHDAAISWSSRLQPTVATSTSEAEYMAAASAIKEALWLRKLLNDLHDPVNTITILCDNQGALKLLKHPVASVRSKHIDIMHHFARERVARRDVQFQYCSTDQMIADCMTKALPESKFVFCRTGMGVLN